MEASSIEWTPGSWIIQPILWASLWSLWEDFEIALALGTLGEKAVVQVLRLSLEPSCNFESTTPFPSLSSFYF